MNDMVVTQAWMGGVILLMAVYGVFAVVGWNKVKSRR